MMNIRQCVTEWGFPALVWSDRVATMKGHPANTDARIDTRLVVRSLHINFDGLQVLHAIDGRTQSLGGWQEWVGLAIGSSRDDLTPDEARILAKNRLKWVEHRTLTAIFNDGTQARVAGSAVGKADIEELHRVIHRTFVAGRLNYVAPKDGVPFGGRGFSWQTVPLEPGETSPTRVDVSESECRHLEVIEEFPVPSVVWREPVRTKERGLLGFGAVKHHLVTRMLFVGRGSRPGIRDLAFHSFKPGNEGVVVVKADFSFLKGFRVVDSRETNPLGMQPLRGTLPGLSVVADFRYGMMLPLTCAYVANDDVRRQFEALAESMRKGFLLLVGQSLSDEQRWQLVDYIAGLDPRDEPGYAELLQVAWSEEELDLARGAELFAAAAPVYFSVVGQVTEPGRAFHPSANGVTVRAVYNRHEIAFLVSWHDLRADRGGSNAPDLPVPPAEDEGEPTAAPAEVAAGGEFWGEAEAAAEEPAAEGDFWGDEGAGATDAEDSSAASNTGTYNDVTLGVPSFNSILGSAAEFDGELSSVSVPALQAVGQFTIEAWIKPNVYSTWSVIYNSDAYPDGAVHFQLIDDNKVEFAMNGNAPEDVNFGDNSAFAEGQWSYVAVTFSTNTSSMTVYVNGSPYNTNVYTTVVAASFESAHVGAWNGDDRQFDGLIDELAIYPAELTPAQIQAHYQAAVGLFISVISHPQEAAVFAGSAATFSASATIVGSAELPRYQWQRNGTNIPGATLPLYTLPVTSTADHNAAFRCITASAFGTNASTIGGVDGWSYVCLLHPLRTGTSLSSVGADGRRPNRRNWPSLTISVLLPSKRREAGSAAASLWALGCHLLSPAASLFPLLLLFLFGGLLGLRRGATTRHGGLPGFRFLRVTRHRLPMLRSRCCGDFFGGRALAFCLR
jgi:hypothetical protein